MSKSNSGMGGEEGRRWTKIQIWWVWGACKTSKRICPQSWEKQAGSSDIDVRFISPSMWTRASLQVLHPDPSKASTATLPASSLLSIIHFSCPIKWGLRSTSTGESTGCHPLDRTFFSKARTCLQVAHAKRAVFLTQRGAKRSGTWYSQPEGSWERETARGDEIKEVKCPPGSSLAVQWLGLGAFIATALGAIPGWGTKIPKLLSMARINK